MIFHRCRSCNRPIIRTESGRETGLMMAVRGVVFSQGTFTVRCSRCRTWQEVPTSAMRSALVVAYDGSCQVRLGTVSYEVRISVAG